MATIRTVLQNKYSATFNKRSLQISHDERTVKAVDITTGELVEGPELRSIRSLLEWHIKSKRESSELPTIATVAK